MSVPDFLRTWAALPGPARVLAAARDRTEAGRLGPRARMEIDLTASQRAEVGRILEPSWAASEGAVPIAELRRSLAAHGTTLEDLLTAVGGPLRDLRAERREDREKRHTERTAALEALSLLAGPNADPDALARCLAGAHSPSARATEITLVIDHLDELQTSGVSSIRLPVLAARLFGDAHALDRGAGLGRAVARFLRARDVSAAPYADPLEDTTTWRAAWELGGVACDEVSAQVLVLNLPLTGDGPAARLAAVAGEPVWLTLRSLRAPFSLTEGTEQVFVCENPAIVEAAADQHGVSSQPLICTFGLPSLAAMALLQGLAPMTTLMVRADGDAVGHRIVDRLLHLPGAQRWRMPPGFDKYEEEILDDLLPDLAIPWPRSADVAAPH